MVAGRHQSGDWMHYLTNEHGAKDMGVCYVLAMYGVLPCLVMNYTSESCRMPPVRILDTLHVPRPVRLLVSEALPAPKPLLDSI